jgi:DNA-binding NarL/FixJ family response regulator
MRAFNSTMPMLAAKILVVEDYEQFRRFIVSTLRRGANFQIMEASNGLEALQKAEEYLPDLVLLDIGLPGLNGIEVARRLRRLVLTKIVFVSQESSPEVVGEALALGALGYVHKPRAGSDLRPAVEAVLEGKRFVSTGLEVNAASDVADHPHEILFCRDEAALLDGLSRFIATALNARNAALVLATESHQGSLLQRLLTRGVDIDAAVKGGTYITLDADEEPDPAQFFHSIKALSEAASKAGKAYPRVAFCGERAGRLWAEGKTDEAIRLEQLCGQVAKDHDVDILCVYPLPHNLQDDGFKDICTKHTAVSFR